MASSPQAASSPQTTATEASVSLLDEAISVTKQTEPQRVEELMRTLANEAMSGTVQFKKNMTVTLREAIAKIDAQISEQLAAIMHGEKFKQMEGSWRGLHYLVKNSEIGESLKIQMLNATKKEIAADLSKATDFDQSQLYKKVYEEQFGTPGGQPFGALMGDFYFSKHPDDIELLGNIASVAAAGFTPFVAAADSKLFGMDSFGELSNPMDLRQLFETADYTKWNSFRQTEDSRFVTLAMPRVLARLPYGKDTKPIEGFAYEEAPRDAAGAPQAMDHDDYCWMNAAYALMSRMTDAFAQYGWCTAIRGAEGGGKVTNLPTHVFQSDDGDLDTKCPTEIGITDRREKELSDLGFLPLCHYKNTDYSVFFGAQTTQKPKKYDRREATENAAISARLPYIMATSRFAHYLKVMARDKIGSFMEASDCESWLNRWISNYVNATEGAGQEARAKYPLREARVEVREVEGSPGSYSAIAHLRPWLQFEELTTSMRLVARIPKVA
ncbi:type VI secretion system contractile sheath large subunit [Sphingomonas sp. MAH-20]|uniref:Type VI secretion system contractile sheath large subunit n=1 Tax=Sphingomonas horti TaxID=2682842 RepID=A0A6I4IXZ3_9SPHN|nr:MULTISPECIES: type VI secretion system contractile sheath large subunit [Sphingomonas]MBA2920551.1 type VI secretion system contractile sheath large subunit [Sphingomonas sp. CGMCC 1.13658]MVO76803.1 type VI secretion system contractile sheath large subunit [Sphingomonas horti]